MTTGNVPPVLGSLASHCRGRGHRRPLGKTDGNARVTCIDRMEFDEAGHIKPIRITHEGVAADPIE